MRDALGWVSVLERAWQGGIQPNGAPLPGPATRPAGSGMIWVLFGRVGPCVAWRLVSPAAAAESPLPGQAGRLGLWRAKLSCAAYVASDVCRLVQLTLPAAQCVAELDFRHARHVHCLPLPQVGPAVQHAARCGRTGGGR